MLEAVRAIHKKPMRKVKQAKSTPGFENQPFGVGMVDYELSSGRKSKKYLLEHVDACKSALEKAIAYMCEKGMITKHPIHPTNPCKGMQYEKVYTDSSTINGAND